MESVKDSRGTQSGTETTHKVGDTVIKDSGARQVFTTGAHRDQAEGKGAFNLIPFIGLQRIAKIFEAGGKKYTKSNWRLGMPVSKYLDCAIRHAMKAANGWKDEDHMAMAAWNFICAMETEWMCEQGHLSAELNDVHDFLTSEGVAKAFDKIRAENEQRLKSKNMQNTQPVEP